MTAADASAASDAGSGDLGFSHRVRKDGAVEILHNGRLASTLRGADATSFQRKMEAGFAAGQQLMARVTGNYKHGNEGAAGSHPRNAT